MGNFGRIRRELRKNGRPGVAVTVEWDDGKKIAYFVENLTVVPDEHAGRKALYRRGQRVDRNVFTGKFSQQDVPLFKKVPFAVMRRAYKGEPTILVESGKTKGEFEEIKTEQFVARIRVGN